MFRRLRRIIEAIRGVAERPGGRVGDRVETVRGAPVGRGERGGGERLKEAGRLAELGRVAEAIAVYREVGRSDPVEAARGLREAARAAQRTRRVSTEWTDEVLPPPMAVEDRMAAIAYYRAAVELGPGASGALLGLARLLPADSDERVGLLETALANDARAYRVAVELGDAWFVRGDVGKAAEAYERAVGIGAGEALAYRRLVWVYERSGDEAAARQWRRRESERPMLRRRAARDRVRTGGVGKPVWCVVANVREERRFGPGGEMGRRGTKHFPPGAKVYCDQSRWGDGYEKIVVVGLHRGRGRRKWVRMVVPARALCNARAKMVYEPAVLRRLDERWDDSSGSKETAEGLAGVINARRG